MTDQPDYTDKTPPEDVAAATGAEDPTDTADDTTDDDLDNDPDLAVVRGVVYFYGGPEDAEDPAANDPGDDPTDDDPSNHEGDDVDEGGETSE